jgi:hypothetical protein
VQRITSDLNGRKGGAGRDAGVAKTTGRNVTQKSRKILKVLTADELVSVGKALFFCLAWDICQLANMFHKVRTLLYRWRIVPHIFGYKCDYERTLL